MFLQTPYRHEIHSDVQERITEAFETDCEFREIAACYTQSGDIITFQLLFLPVSAIPTATTTLAWSFSLLRNIASKAQKETKGCQGFAYQPELLSHELQQGFGSGMAGSLCMCSRSNLQSLPFFD